MNKVTLGTTDIMVSRMGFGCMGMSEFYGPSDDQASLEVLEKSFELGINFYDTADMYGHGHNEELLSRFLKGRRDKVVLATKFGIYRAEKGKYERKIINSTEYMRSCLESSLKRLGTDVIDLYYVHRLAQDRPVEDVVGDLARLVDEGKIRHIGLSEVSADILRRAAKVHTVAAVQSEYSLVTRDVEQNGVLDTCKETGTAIVAYSPLGRGFLSGTIKDAGQPGPNGFQAVRPALPGRKHEQEPGPGSGSREYRPKA